jgi:cbb3-type cytochrome oxidase subunit 3
MLMSNLFRLWYVVRQTAIMEHIVGEETLGMTADTKDRPVRLDGKIPLPPIMSHQLDMMLSIKLVRPLKKGVLDNLQRIIIANRPKSWFTIYLCIFILLHTASVLTRHRYDYARTKGLKVCEPAQESVRTDKTCSNGCLFLNLFRSFTMAPTFFSRTTTTGTAAAIPSA